MLHIILNIILSQPFQLPRANSSLPNPVTSAINAQPPYSNPLVLKITPPFTSPASADPSAYYFWANSAANPGDATRMDALFNLGYNCAKGGGTQVSSLPGMCMLMESYWNDGGGIPYVEWHLAFIKAASSQVRFITAAMRTDTETVQLGFNANSYYWNTLGAGATSSLLALSGGTIAVAGNIDKQTTGTFIRQYDGVAFRSVIYQNSTSGRAEIGDAGANGSTIIKDTLFTEEAAPTAPAANNVILFSQDSGGGKTQLCARFNTGAVQCFATEP